MRIVRKSIAEGSTVIELSAVVRQIKWTPIVPFDERTREHVIIGSFGEARVAMGFTGICTLTEWAVFGECLYAQNVLLRELEVHGCERCRERRADTTYRAPKIVSYAQMQKSMIVEFPIEEHRVCSACFDDLSTVGIKIHRRCERVLI